MSTYQVNCEHHFVRVRVRMVSGENLLGKPLRHVGIEDWECDHCHSTTIKSFLGTPEDAKKINESIDLGKSWTK